MSKKILAFLCVLVFAGLGTYYFYAEDYCPVHNASPRGAFSHTHRGQAAVCLCFWNNLFSTVSYDFHFVQDVERLVSSAGPAFPANPFDSDIGHPPKLFPA
jgi:hypothetical protein